MTTNNLTPIERHTIAKACNALMRASRQALGPDIPDAWLRDVCTSAVNDAGPARLAERPIDEAELANDIREAIAQAELAKLITSAFRA